jgi:hypothetical protein
MPRDRDRRPHFLYITGSDGTGKSTQAGLLASHLEGKGIRCRCLYLRFPFLFSIPFLAYARWRGYSWREVNKEATHGYWDFSRSRVMRILFPWIFLLDALLAAIGMIHIFLLFGGTIICERFVLDMLVDLSIATQDPGFSDHLPGRLFLELIPQDAGTVILDLDRETICRRRPNLAFDHALASRLEAYRLLGNKLQLPVINTLPPVPRVFDEILAEMHIV